tara:strand:+ start:19 stop:870 length:852 start_codon:yes stop_codon:yes gene_type:complete
MKKKITKILLSKYLIDILNYFLIRILRIKNILSPDYDYVGKFFLVKKNDIFIASFPKSGNTWVRLIVANLLNKKPNFNNIDHFLPETYSYKESFYFQNSENIRIFKSHDYFDHRFKKVIYVVRDPREIIVSSYFFQMKIGTIKKNYSKKKFIIDFIKGKYSANFGTWEQNVGSWYGSRNQNIIFVRYEDLKEKPRHEIKKISKFLKIKISDKKILKIINRTSFKNLQSEEKKDSLKWNSIKSKSNIPFFRSGKKNSWKKFFTPDENNLIKKTFGRHMKIFNYK